MLVLTRVPGESIMVGDGIEVVVVKVSGKQVRLGFKVKDPSLVIRRREIAPLPPPEHLEL